MTFFAFLEGLLKLVEPFRCCLPLAAIVLIGVTGDGRPFPSLFLEYLYDDAVSSSGSSIASLLGAGVKLLLDPLVAGFAEFLDLVLLMGKFKPLAFGKLANSASGASEDFF